MRLDFMMREGNALAQRGVEWACDTATIIVSDGAIYVRKGELWVYYSDPMYGTKEHLDTTQDCRILKVEQLAETTEE